MNTFERTRALNIALDEAYRECADLERCIATHGSLVDRQRQEMINERIEALEATLEEMQPTWQDIAEVEGWCLFEGNGHTELERDDEAGLFESDLHAVMHVISLCVRGSRPHREALQAWLEADPRVFVETIKMVLSEIPGGDALLDMAAPK